ncbi:unnamed protein product [Urochloa humidicola]
MAAPQPQQGTEKRRAAKWVPFLVAVALPCLVLYRAVAPGAVAVLPGAAAVPWRHNVDLVSVSTRSMPFVYGDYLFVKYNIVILLRTVIPKVQQEQRRTVSF